MSPPLALSPFLRFAQTLRKAGFAVSPDQTIGFIQAVGLLGPTDMTDIFRSGRALFSVPPERLAEYEAIFRAVFLDHVIQAPATGDEEDEVSAYEPTPGMTEIEAADDENEAGTDPTGAERLGHRQISAMGEAEVLEWLSRALPEVLPRRRSYRRGPSSRGDRLDMRRILREASRRDGDTSRLFQTRRKSRQRRVLLLIDVSGSMKNRSPAALRLAHVVMQAADRAEVFTLGTRLTRITSLLRPADREQALARATSAISDFDGGTRIGDALQAFLAVPRYAGFVRGAAVTVLSDGLERGTPDAMIDAVTRISRSAWRTDWLSPLAADPDFRPATAGLIGILPVLDRLGDGSTTESIAHHILTMARST